MAQKLNWPFEIGFFSSSFEVCAEKPDIIRWLKANLINKRFKSINQHYLEMVLTLVEFE